eukprot:CAMPEP_0119544974 /NCGR_PEP_ID=MMETSP1344-20130328/55006_1 /TAXON_ID=236787 /ORGANISM="Florenciella parvula, Strain CCMP2471" /LENGTH=232 /DNA_ID=CAMNT_0007589487 /DNA_START=615 /DNA_END=1310 /DNA_ORIENTATION=+
MVSTSSFAKPDSSIDATWERKAAASFTSLPSASMSSASPNSALICSWSWSTTALFNFPLSLPITAANPPGLEFAFITSEPRPSHALIRWSMSADSRLPLPTLSRAPGRGFFSSAAAASVASVAGNGTAPAASTTAAAASTAGAAASMTGAAASTADAATSTAAASTSGTAVSAASDPSTTPARSVGITTCSFAPTSSALITRLELLSLSVSAGMMAGGMGSAASSLPLLSPL